MYTLVRSATVNTGKAEAATAFAHEVTAFLRERYDLNISVHRGLFADIGKIIWLAEYESLAQYEELGQALASDEDYQQLLQSSLGNFVAGSVHDQMVVSL